MSPATKKGHGAGARPANAGQRFPAEVLTTDEVQAILRRCSPRAATGIRNRALIVLMWRAGLRVSEALALRPKDVDLERGEVRILHGKGDKARVVGLDPQAVSIVAAWMQWRKMLDGVDGRRPLLCTLDGGPVYSSYVRTLLRRLGEKAGIEKRVHPHGLRHTFAVQLLREGANMAVIQGALGHESIATTSRYLAHLAPEEVIDTMKGRTW